jgi:SulP family sulfate permease
VTGPTAAFIVILAPIASHFGVSGLLTAGFLAGFLLLGMGLARLGRLVQFIPYPVTAGFTTGIAVVIATLQLKDALGLRLDAMPEHFPDKLAALLAAIDTARPVELAFSAGTLAMLVGLPFVTKRVPPPLVALTAAALGAWAVGRFAPHLAVDTMGTRFSSVVDGVTIRGIPRALPLPAMPWGEGLPSWDTIRSLLPSAFAIAVLGAIESLLSGVIADGMTGTRHDPDGELVGQDIGNLLAPVFGGIAATGALARTATNIRSGARSPVAAVVHTAVVLLAILALAPLLAYLPMASLAALLLLVAWNMSEVRHFARTLRIAPKSDKFVLLTCFALTVLFDMVIAIAVGVVLAALLFMRRMAELTDAQLVVGGAGDEVSVGVPEGVALYEVHGALFFGAAQKAMEELAGVQHDRSRVVVLALGDVRVVDATGLVNLESAIEALERRKVDVVLAGPLPRPTALFAAARLEERYERVRIARTLPEALELAEQLAASSPPPGEGRSRPPPP